MFANPSASGTGFGGSSVGAVCRSGWVGPVLLLILGALMALAMGAVQLGAGAVELSLFVVGLTAVAGLAASRPETALAGLGFSLATLPYLEPLFRLGKQAPLLLTVSIILGCVAGLSRWLVTESRASLAFLAAPTGLFCNLLLVSAVITTVRYSPVVANTLGDMLGGFSRVDAAGGGSTSIFLLQAASFATGPILAVLVIQLGRLGDRTLVSSDELAQWLLAGILAGSVLSFAACLGQAASPAFPLPSRDPRWPTGLMTNPGGLAALAIMLLPVCVALVMARMRPRWLRTLAGVNLLVILASLGPLDSKTAQVGVLLSLGVYGTVLLLRRAEGSLLRKGLVAVGLAVGVVAVLAGLVRLLGVVGISDWADFVAQSSFGFRPSRLERMRQLVLMFLEHPVAGTGVGTFRLLLPGFYAKYGTSMGGTVYLEATNHLLHMTATGGLIGLAATVWMLAAFFARPLWDAQHAGLRPSSLWRLKRFSKSSSTQ